MKQLQSILLLGATLMLAADGDNASGASKETKVEETKEDGTKVTTTETEKPGAPAEHSKETTVEKPADTAPAPDKEVRKA